MQTFQTDQRKIKEKSFLIIASFIVLYFGTFQQLIQTWSSSEDYGHGFVILPISLYLIWKKKEILLNERIEPSGWGYIFMILWIVFYVFGIVGNISTLADISMIMFLIGSVSVLIGRGTVKEVIFPICFLLFMFPIPSEIYIRITNPLMLFATGTSYYLLGIFNIPILKEGNLLFLPNYSMEVVNACSGIRSLSMITALALLIGYFTTTSNSIRVLFFIISIPIAIFGNVLRITITALLAYFWSTRAAEGFSHTIAGLVTFLVSLGILYGCMELVSWSSKTRET